MMEWLADKSIMIGAILLVASPILITIPVVIW